MRAIRGAILLGLAALFLMGFSVNGSSPGSTGSMLPLAPGTAAPTAVASCSTYRSNFRIDNKGSANCYIAPAVASSPCAAASPAPNAGTGAGIWLAPNSTWIFNTQGIYPGMSNQAGAEWDIVCDAAGNKIYFMDMP
jgi:hypothetical protein